MAFLFDGAHPRGGSASCRRGDGHPACRLPRRGRGVALPLVSTSLHPQGEPYSPHPAADGAPVAPRASPLHHLARPFRNTPSGWRGSSSPFPALYVAARIRRAGATPSARAPRRERDPTEGRATDVARTCKLRPVGALSSAHRRTPASSSSAPLLAARHSLCASAQRRGLLPRLTPPLPDAALGQSCFCPRHRSSDVVARIRVRVLETAAPAARLPTNACSSRPPRASMLEGAPSTTPATPASPCSTRLRDACDRPAVAHLRTPLRGGCAILSTEASTATQPRRGSSRRLLCPSAPPGDPPRWPEGLRLSACSEATGHHVTPASGINRVDLPGDDAPNDRSAGIEEPAPSTAQVACRSSAPGSALDYDVRASSGRHRRQRSGATSTTSPTGTLAVGAGTLRRGAAGWSAWWAHRGEAVPTPGPGVEVAGRPVFDATRTDQASPLAAIGDVTEVEHARIVRLRAPPVPRGRSGGASSTSWPESYDDAGPGRGPRSSRTFLGQQRPPPIAIAVERDIGSTVRSAPHGGARPARRRHSSRPLSATPGIGNRRVMAQANFDALPDAGDRSAPAATAGFMRFRSAAVEPPARFRPSSRSRRAWPLQEVEAAARQSPCARPTTAMKACPDGRLSVTAPQTSSAPGARRHPAPGGRRLPAMTDDAPVPSQGQALPPPGRLVSRTSVRLRRRVASLGFRGLHDGRGARGRGNRRAVLIYTSRFGESPSAREGGLPPPYTSGSCACGSGCAASDHAVPVFVLYRGDVHPCRASASCLRRPRLPRAFVDGGASHGGSSADAHRAESR